VTSPLRTRITRVLALLLVALVLTGVAATPASAASATDEQDFVNRINQERASQGRRALTVCAAMVDVARAWSDHEANRNAGDTMGHNPSYTTQIPSGWKSAAENVAWGSGSNATVAVLHQSLMNSPTHSTNILGDFTHVGVGVTLTGSGSSLQMYVTQNFAKYPSDTGCAASSTPPPSSSITLTVDKGTYDKGTKSKAVLRWSGANGSDIEVWRNGAKRKTTKNDGRWNDKFGALVTGTYSYKVCQVGGSPCSPTVSVTF
jgi:uncharacterized protein YkwD